MSIGMPEVCAIHVERYNCGIFRTLPYDKKSLIGGHHMLWNKSYETGVPLMDTQHQELFRNLDILADKTQADSVPQVLDFLGKYVNKHFRDEEHLHLSSAYPERAAHKQMHAAFIEDYKSLMDEYRKKPESQGLMTLRINRIATDWLKKHISGPDAQFAKYYHERNANIMQPPAGTKPETSALSTDAPRIPRPVATSTASAGSMPLSSGKNVCPTDDEVLRRVSAQALAEELVRRAGPNKSSLFRK